MYRDSRHERGREASEEKRAYCYFASLPPDWRYNNFCGRRSGVRHEGKSLACVSFAERSDVDEIIKFLLAEVLLDEMASKIELYYRAERREKKKSRVATK